MGYCVSGLIVFFIGFMAIGFIKGRNEYRNEWLLLLIADTFTTFALFLVLVAGSTLQPRIYAERPVSDIPMQSVKSTPGVAGSFVVGSGSVGSVDYFYVLLKNKDDSYYKIKITSATAIIYETDDAPHLVTIECMNYGKYTELLWYPLNRTLKDHESSDCGCEHYRYVLYVPHGTTIETYTVM